MASTSCLVRSSAPQFNATLVSCITIASRCLHFLEDSWGLCEDKSSTLAFRPCPPFRLTGTNSFVVALQVQAASSCLLHRVSPWHSIRRASSVELCLSFLLRIEDESVLPLRDSLRFASLRQDRALVSLRMRAQLHARQLAARAPAAPRSKHRSGLRPRPSYTALTPPTVSSGPTRAALRRAVRVDDRELFRRVRRVQRWQDLSRSSAEHTPSNLVSQGWRWRRQKKGVELYTRQSPMISVTGAPLGAQTLPVLLDSEVLAVGNVACSIGQLAQPLRSPSESNYNSFMHTLYGSDFIYGSLVHKATFRRRSRNDSADAALDVGHDRSKQLLVKTCAFVHTSMFDKKNEQLCYAELFSPTSSGGFSIASCSLAAREVIVGKVRAPLRRALHQLHPCSSWFSAEPVSSGVHVVFRARFHRSESDGLCSSKVMNARLWKLAKGVCKLGKLVDSIAQPTRGLSSSFAHTVSGGPRNSRCIVCTRALHHIFMARSCSRCELCSYNVCGACCSKQHVTIYNRHVAPLLVCARCRESLDRDEFDSQLRAVNPSI